MMKIWKMMKSKETDKIIRFLGRRDCNLIQNKHNPNTYYADYCPCCRHKSKIGKVFRYNAKLKVGKCYNCGFSFKSMYKLISRLPYKLVNLKDNGNDRAEAGITFKSSDIDHLELPF